ncbi:hypothetical protein HYX08_03095 [Candidatus Woesearchaeota archaeon]|nr:hypothetical protein [Candidatus Woesearchaeota archaeon]
MYYPRLRIIHPFRYLERYPKFLLLFITFLVAYIIFYSNEFSHFHDFIVSLGYSGTFAAGMMFSYGFTAGPATAIFLILAEQQNIYLASVIGGIGALISDLFIFSFIRHSFADEIRKLSKESIVRYFNGRLPGKIKQYCLPVVGGLVIASPLPDEIGVTMLAASKIISTKAFAVMSYTLNTLGILAVYLIGKIIG